MTRIKVKATKGENILVGYIAPSDLTVNGGVVVYDDIDAVNDSAYMYRAAQWKIEPIIEIPTKPFAVIKVGGILMVNLGDKRNNLLDEAAVEGLPWVRITNDGYGNSYGERYIKDRISVGEKFEVIYHGEG